MTGLWLSVLPWHEQHPGSKLLPTGLLDEVEGIHIDVFPKQPPSLAAAVIASVRGENSEIPYDVHFIDVRDDRSGIIRELEVEAPGLRYVYAPSTEQSVWPIAISATTVVRGEADDLLYAQSRVLIRPPSKSMEASERLRVLEDAVDRVVELARDDVAIVLDGDVDGRLAFLKNRQFIAEIVVGKAIVDQPNAIQAARSITRSWSDHNE